jgi:hypothetical protein
LAAVRENATKQPPNISDPSKAMVKKKKKKKGVKKNNYSKLADLLYHFGTQVLQTTQSSLLVSESD